MAESELYSGSKLERTKRNIERLGFFEEVKFSRERSEEDPKILNYEIIVKEKPTGQLNVAAGFQPSSGGRSSSWFGQGSYKNDNQSGRGWRTGLSGKWDGKENYDLDLTFAEPSIDDGPWSFSTSLFLRNSLKFLSREIEFEEQKVGLSVGVGRRIYELVRASIRYSISRTKQDENLFSIDRLNQNGIASTLGFSLSRNSTNNYLDPSEGSSNTMSYSLTGGPVLGGDFDYTEFSLDSAYYYPIDFAEDFRTYFKLHGAYGQLFPYNDKAIPFLERYRLGGPNDLRGYDFQTIGPKFNIVRSPYGPLSSINEGGDKKLFFQLEYYVPLIREVGLKGLVFTDAGQVFKEGEDPSFSNFKKDIGFGFRWITPMAPFRFEWAYPIEEDGSIGDLNFVFFLGF